MTGQTDTVARKRRTLIAVGVLLLALCAGGAYLALKGGKTGGATLGGYDDMSGATAARAASSGRRSPKRTDRATHIRGYGTAGKTGDAARWIRNAAHVRGERRGECTSCGFAPKRTDMKGDGEDGQCSALMRS